MTDCPPRLRGDLSKWLQEINTGVYVGNVNSRVRDAIWNRVCENLKTGRATMVFSTNNEQKMDFRVHNTLWMPVDFEGIQLMRRPLPNSAETEAPLKPGFSKAAKRQMGERRKQAAAKSGNTFVVMDLETTGLHPASDTILELGAILVENDHPAATFSRLIKTDAAIPRHISDLTGIDRSLMEQEGLPLPTALAEFLEFIGSRPLVGYNISFDMSFLQAACRGCSIQPPTNRCIDLLTLARRKIFGISDYKLATLAAHFSISMPSHRALSDCQTLLQLYEKLNEKQAAPG